MAVLRLQIPLYDQVLEITLYDQNSIKQSGSEKERGRMNEELRRGPTPELNALPTCKLLTDGSGKVWAVDENGSPWYIYG